MISVMSVVIMIAYMTVGPSLLHLLSLFHVLTFFHANDETAVAVP